MSWIYEEQDIGLMLFTACLNAGAPIGEFAPGMRVLEIGSCEADWLHRAHDAWPDVTFVGIDTRAPNVTDADGMVIRMAADARKRAMFPTGFFDAVVSISAIEHIGLGHYNDPIDPDGDTVAVENAWYWLKPGGTLYFDVPYDPLGYRVQGTKCRVYDTVALAARFKAIGAPAWTGYAEGHSAGTLIRQPKTSVQPFHYVASVYTKPTP